VRERGGPSYTPHFVLHFGDPSELPLRVQCAAPLDKSLSSMSIPIYTYELREGARAFDFALRAPGRTEGFDPAPGIRILDIRTETNETETITSLRLTSDTMLCGPSLLGSLRLATAGLPDAFRVTMSANSATGRCAVLAADGEWHPATLDRGGARVGLGLSCPEDRCVANSPIDDLEVAPGERTGLVDLSWRRGSGNYTMTTDRITHLVTIPGDLRIAAWSITRGSFGSLFAASSVECGALASIHVELPVATAPSSWTQVKTLYR
jgi:hypothetical protein